MFKNILLISVCIFTVLGIHCTTDMAGTTDETESGRIFGFLVEYTEGKPVADARVWLYTGIDSGTTIAPPIDSTVTNLEGRYQFDNVAMGYYHIEACYIHDGDTLRAYHFRINTYLGQAPGADGVYDAGIDTLKIPGTMY